MTGALDAAAWVDTHVHIFERGLRFASARRYAPDYDATARDLKAQMLPSRVSKAVLVQPSFLGFDNNYVLDAISKDPGMFSGIAVVEPDIDAAALDALRHGGIVGVRLNCIGRPAPDLARGAYRALADRLAAAGLVLEIQAEAEQWGVIAPELHALPCTVLVDHFGRTAIGDASGGFESLLAAADTTERLWFKFSGPYRFAPGKASACASAILAAVGINRIVWGSDWPWTLFEGHHSYQDTLDWLTHWVPNAADRQTILSTNPARLFGLPALSSR